MEKCETKPSSEISVKENRLYKLRLTVIEKEWVDAATEPYKIESYRSKSGHYFSVIYGLVHGEVVSRITVHCDDKASISDVRTFTEVVFRPEIVATFQHMVALDLQSERYLDTFLEKFKEVTDNEYSGEDTYDLYLPTGLSRYEIIPELPELYSFGKLSDNHVEFLAKIWVTDLGIPNPVMTRYESFIRQNIQRPHVAIFHEKEEFPVGWMMVYHDGSIGQMHVTTPYRRKGLGKIIARKMFNVVFDELGIGSSCNINIANTASARLFLSEGWEKQGRSFKMYLFPTDSREAES